MIGSQRETNTIDYTRRFSPWTTFRRAGTVTFSPLLFHFINPLDDQSRDHRRKIDVHASISLSPPAQKRPRSFLHHTPPGPSSSVAQASLGSFLPTSERASERARARAGGKTRPDQTKQDTSSDDDAIVPGHAEEVPAASRRRRRLLLLLLFSSSPPPPPADAGPTARSSSCRRHPRRRRLCRRLFFHHAGPPKTKDPPQAQATARRRVHRGLYQRRRKRWSKSRMCSPQNTKLPRAIAKSLP